MADTLEVWWEGADGSLWSLLDRSSPVHATSIDGLGMPGFTNRWAELAGFDGQRYEGTTWGANTVNLTVTVSDPIRVPYPTGRRKRDDWRALDAAWRRSLSAEKPGRLTVVSGAGRRTLELRLDAPFATPPKNPGARGQATYQHVLTAGDRPWWEGEEIPHEYEWSAVSQPFFGGADGQVLLYISKSSTSDRATIVNPGDREAWPRWWARGPFTSVALGIGGDTVRLPISLGDKQKVFVDSFEQSITDEAGANLWPLMGYANPTFGPIPAGEEVPLAITFTGPAAGAALGVSIVPRFHGPW